MLWLVVRLYLVHWVLRPLIRQHKASMIYVKSHVKSISSRGVGVSGEFLKLDLSIYVCLLCCFAEAVAFCASRNLFQELMLNQEWRSLQVAWREIKEL
jgi:hypothetical protein